MQLLNSSDSSIVKLGLYRKPVKLQVSPVFFMFSVNQGGRPWDCKAHNESYDYSKHHCHDVTYQQHNQEVFHGDREGCCAEQELTAQRLYCCRAAGIVLQRLLLHPPLNASRSCCFRPDLASWVKPSSRATWRSCLTVMAPMKNLAVSGATGLGSAWICWVSSAGAGGQSQHWGRGRGARWTPTRQGQQQGHDGATQIHQDASECCKCDNDD